MSVIFKDVAFGSVHVRSLARARPFYEHVLGLRAVYTADDEIIYAFGSTHLAVHADPDGMCGRPPGGPSGFYLVVEDILEAVAQARAAGVEAVDIDARSATVEDPDGNVFVFLRFDDPWPPA